MPRDDGAPQGAVSLSDAISSLREELLRASWGGRDERLRFKPGAVELTLEVAVTGATTGAAGVKWWLLEAGGEVSRERVSTQTITMKLEPVMLDAAGQPTEFLVDDVDSPATTSDEHDLDSG